MHRAPCRDLVVVSLIWVITRGFVAQVAPRFTRASVCVVVMVLVAGLHGSTMRSNRPKRTSTSNLKAAAGGGAAGGGSRNELSSPSSGVGGDGGGGGITRLTRREHFTLLIATCMVSAVVVCWICSWADITATIKVR